MQHTVVLRTEGEAKQHLQWFLPLDSSTYFTHRVRLAECKTDNFFPCTSVIFEKNGVKSSTLEYQC
jgi:hypothetical protein